MTLHDICCQTQATLVCGDLDRPVSGVYVGDLLSRAMSHVQQDDLWVTIMSNVNVVAVASLTEPAAVLLAEDVVLQPEALQGARENGITVLSSPLSAYEICGRVHRILQETDA